MALAQNFAIIENDPEWGELTLPEQNQIRRAWVSRRMAVSNRPRDPELQKQLETEAFKGAPEFARPYEPSWKERHPSLYAAGATAVGVPMTLLETPQQIVANILDPMLRGKRYPATFGGVLSALREPFQKTGEWMMSQREPTRIFPEEAEGLELAARTITDPLQYFGVGLGKKLAGEAVAGIPKAVTAIPRLRGRRAAEEVKKALTAPGVAEWVEEIPRSWATWAPEGRTIYTRIMRIGQQYIPKKKLQRVAETIVNVGPEQGAQAIKILREGNKNKIKSLISWAEMPSWSRKALKGVKKGEQVTQPGVGQKVGEAAQTVAEEINQPGSWADYLQRMMESPKL